MLKTLTYITSVSTLALLATTAMAQTAPAPAADPAAAPDAPAPRQPTDNEIVVTGTLIKGIAPVGTNVVGVSRADISSSGATTALDVMATVPEISNAFNALPTPGTGLSGGTSVRPSIRNISAAGGSATLLLLNGHNMVGVGILQTAPDINIIPAGMLERVDVVADGGSALYGSDAIAGTINMITRKHMNGVEVSGQYGLANHYTKQDFNITGGKDWGSGSLIVSYENRHNSDLLGRYRSYYRTNLTPFGGSDNRVTNCNPGNVVADGVNYALPNLAPNTTNKCDADLYTDLQPAETQNSVFGSLTQRLTDRLQFDLTAFWTRRDTTILTAQLASSGTITAANPYFIPVGGATSETVQYNYAATNGNSAVNTTRTQEYGITPTLKFDMGHHWDVTLLGNYGHSKTNASSAEVNAAAESAALASTNTATALNPYNIAATNPSVIQAITNFAQFAQNVQTLEQVRLDVSGPLFSLPGGSVKVAAGAQYSHEKSVAYQADAVPGDLSNAAFANQKRTTKSVWGELYVPVFGADNRNSLVYALNLDGSIRYDNYSDFGGTVNPKIGFTYQPTQSFTLRGNYGTSFNAPSLQDEAGAIDSRAQVLLSSPYQPVGSNFNANIGRPTILLAGGGNNIGPQTAHTYSFGADYKPSFVPGLTMSLTYWAVNLFHAINIYPFYSPSIFTTPAFASTYVLNPTLAQAQALIGNEHVQGPSLATLYSANNIANGTTPYAIFNATRTNLGNFYYRGLDFKMNYQHPTSFGSINGSVSGTYYLKNASLAVGGTTELSAFDPSQGGLSRMQLALALGGSVGNLTMRATMNYSAGFDIAPITTGAVTQTHVDSFHPVNLYFAYDIKDAGALSGTTLTLHVDNVANENPPYKNVTGAGFGTVDGTGLGQTIGRTFEFGLKHKF
jgi:iron complex outermembrane receptor protein